MYRYTVNIIHSTCSFSLTYVRTKIGINLSRYTDERVKNFPEIKAQLPFGQLPVLTYNGTVIAQSLTIAR